VVAVENVFGDAPFLGIGDHRIDRITSSEGIAR